MYTTMKFLLSGSLFAIIITGSIELQLQDISPPAFTIPYLSQQIAIFHPPVRNFSSLSPVWYYAPAGLLLSDIVKIVLSNRSATHSVTAKIKLWDSDYVHHIQSFINQQTGNAKARILPIPFKWIRLEYHMESDYVQPVKSQWRSVRNFPQTVSFRIVCVSVDTCERIKKHIQNDSASDETNVQLAFAFDIPEPRDVSVCFNGQQIRHTPTFNRINKRLTGYETIYVLQADYYALVHELIAKTIESVSETAEFIDSDQIHRLVATLLPGFYHNMTSAGIMTEEMWRATYWTDKNTPPGQNAHYLQELFGNGMEWLQETVRDDNATDALGAFAHAQSVTDALVQRRSGERRMQWDREKSIARPMMLYCVDVSMLDDKTICNTTLRLSKGRADYVVSAVPLRSAESLRDMPTARCHALEPKGHATWLMRDADTLLSLNHTLIAATIQSMLDGVSVCQAQQLTATTNLFGEMSLFLPKTNGLQLAVTFEVAGYYPITLRNVHLDGNPDAFTAFMEPLLFISRRFTGSGTATGKLYDLSKYSTVLHGIKLVFRTNMNSHNGTAVGSVASLTDGTWSVTLPGGHYTATASKSGYITVPFTVIILGGKSRNYSVTGLSPTLENGVVRIVSLGGEQSRNVILLALHVRGPIEGSSDRAHTHAWDKAIRGSFVRYEVDSWEFASVLIEKQLAGIYRISVSDWHLISKDRNGTLWDMANSGVTVQLYAGNKLWAQYFMSNRAGNAWSVVEINGTHLTTINEVNTVARREDVSENSLQYEVKMTFLPCQAPP